MQARTHTNVLCVFFCGFIYLLQFPFVFGWVWRIRLEKLWPIPWGGPSCIGPRPRCVVESVCSRHVGGCHEGGYGCRNGNGHSTAFVGNAQLESFLQNMKNDNRQKY